MPGDALARMRWSLRPRRRISFAGWMVVAVESAPTEEGPHDARGGAGSRVGAAPAATAMPGDALAPMGWCRIRGVGSASLDGGWSRSSPLLQEEARDAREGVGSSVGAAPAAPAMRGDALAPMRWSSRPGRRISFAGWRAVAVEPAPTRTGPSRRAWRCWIPCRSDPSRDRLDSLVSAQPLPSNSSRPISMRRISLVPAPMA